MTMTIDNDNVYQFVLNRSICDLHSSATSSRKRAEGARREKVLMMMKQTVFANEWQEDFRQLRMALSLSLSRSKGENVMTQVTAEIIYRHSVGPQGCRQWQSLF